MMYYYFMVMLMDNIKVEINAILSRNIDQNSSLIKIKIFKLSLKNFNFQPLPQVNGISINEVTFYFKDKLNFYNLNN